MTLRFLFFGSMITQAKPRIDLESPVQCRMSSKGNCCHSAPLTLFQDMGGSFSSLVLVSVFTLLDGKLNGLTYLETIFIGEGIKKSKFGGW